MAKSISLATLRSDAKLLANQRSTAFLADSEWNRLINLACSELYDLLVSSGGQEYSEQLVTLATTAGSAIVALPQDCYRILTIIANWGQQQLEELRDLGHLGDQTGFRNWNQWDMYSPKAWRQRGPLLEFFPTPNRVTQFELRYVPAFQDLAADSSTIDCVNGWERLVAARAAMDALALQGKPNNAVAEIYQTAKDRITNLAEERAQNAAPTLREVLHGDGSFRWWNRLPWPSSGSGSSQ